MFQQLAIDESEQRAAPGGADRGCNVSGTAQRRVRFIASSRLPTRWGTFVAHSFIDSVHKEHLVLTLGEVAGAGAILTRIHSECLTGDALFSLRCDCGHQLRSALQRIGSEGRGALLYLRQEGRGIGLHNKIRAYGLQDCGADTVDANLRLGFSADAREYAVCGPMLRHIGARRLRLMTNNPAKTDALTAMGFEVVERVALPSGRNAYNAAYLDTKACRMGHVFDLVGEGIGAEQ
ncbi:GTP cyclohydrolase II [Aromatoleum toluclasticum]|uniref:GTP cyclohydrolase II n=1 Tax=Aromatoleum toluclasticum TaxID=92003 RepID=UPI001D194BEA|nr:GTP cyclohydrolase II [Aromatoleum toluclasticum]